MTETDLIINEKKYRGRFGLIAGVDEAGRGPLAGPLVAAACILGDTIGLEKLNDSKKLAPAEREILYQQIIACSTAYSIEIIEPATIDEMNILQATMLGMSRAVNKLEPKPSYVLIDGNRIPGSIQCRAESIVKGDSQVACIAAASVLAKVTRDRIMVELDKQYPQYGFAKHKGYPTRQHFQAIGDYGVCPYHRRSFKPVYACLYPEIQLKINYELTE